jgi:chloramphenicol O-acetyltransferase type B
VRSIQRYLYHHLRQIVVYLVGENRLTARKLTRQGRLTVGEHTVSRTPTVRTYVHDRTSLTIGNYCSINEEAVFMLGGAHPIDSVTTYPHRILWKMDGAGDDGFPDPVGDIVVGSDVWVGAGAWILSGVQIGHGAVIGTSAVVRTHVPPYGIVAGNPARLVGHRHTPEQREALLETAWWDWPEDEVRRAVPLLAGKDIDAFLEYARERFPQQDHVDVPTDKQG